MLMEHGKEIFILFTFPILGLTIESWFSKKIAFSILISSAILLLPVFTPYHYVIPHLYPVFSLLL